MRAVSRWCPGKAEEELLAELSAATTTPPGRRMGADPRRHGVSKQALGPTGSRREGGLTLCGMTIDTAREQSQADEPPAIDIHTTAGKLADLDRRRYEALHAGSQRAVTQP